MIVSIFVGGFGYPSIILFMAVINIGSFNINGCRDTTKRLAMFNYLKLKKADIILLQETHSDLKNQIQWNCDWKGNIIMSHGTNLSAGVAILFSACVCNQPVMFEIIPGRLLRVDIMVGQMEFSFFNVYAPNVGQERKIFFKKLSDALSQCPQDNIVVIGGDFNCTINPDLDRNHDEPHPSSAEILKNVIDYHDFVDLWRDSFPGVKQYTWLKTNSNALSGARLDRFYVAKSNSGRFYNSSIVPSSLSDHHYISVAVSVLSSKTHKSHWHFNNRLLQDHSFIHSFNLFWQSWREERCSFSLLSQWWDMGKVHIKLFCQQYTVHNTRTLKEKMKSLEEDILRQSSHDDSADSIERNTFLLKTLLEEQGKTALLRTRYSQLNEMDAPSAFFFGLEKKPRKQKYFHKLNLSQGGVTTDQQEIRTHALAFYEDLYCAELCDGAATEQILCDLPHLSEEDQQTLDNPISFAELSLAVQELNPGKSPGLDGLSAEFYRVFWNLIGEDLYAVFLESFNQGKLPLSCRRAVLTLIPKKEILGSLKIGDPCH